MFDVLVGLLHRAMSFSDLSFRACSDDTHVHVHPTASCSVHVFTQAGPKLSCILLAIAEHQ